MEEVVVAVVAALVAAALVVAAEIAVVGIAEGEILDVVAADRAVMADAVEIVVASDRVAAGSRHEDNDSGKLIYEQIIE